MCVAFRQDWTVSHASTKVEHLPGRSPPSNRVTPSVNVHFCSKTKGHGGQQLLQERVCPSETIVFSADNWSPARGESAEDHDNHNHHDDDHLLY